MQYFEGVSNVSKDTLVSRKTAGNLKMEAQSAQVKNSYHKLSLAVHSLSMSFKTSVCIMTGSRAPLIDPLGHNYVENEV